MFLVNSRYRRLAATTYRSRRKSFTAWWHTFSRSYGVNLPSSLRRVLSSALVFSTCPPESVSGTVNSLSTQTAAFLGSLGSLTSPEGSASHLGVARAFYSYANRLHACTGIQYPATATLLRPRFAPDYWSRNINLISIGFAFRLHLRDRLTLLG